MTVKQKLFDDDKESRFFHIIWDDTLERKHRNNLYDTLSIMEKNQDLKKCGFYILVISKEMTAPEALEAYTKRDCVEKVFRTGTEKFRASDRKNIYHFIGCILSRHNH